MKGVRIPAGQTNTGRYYNNYQELYRASGRAIRIYVIIEVHDEEIGIRHVRLQWIHGHINKPRYGVKRWEKVFEERLDSIVESIKEKYRKKYCDPDLTVICIEGWKIIDPKVTRIRKRFDAMDHSQDRSQPLVDIEVSMKTVKRAFDNVIPFRPRGQR